METAMLNGLIVGTVLVVGLISYQWHRNRQVRKRLERLYRYE